MLLRRGVVKTVWERRQLWTASVENYSVQVLEVRKVQKDLVYLSPKLGNTYIKGCLLVGKRLGTKSSWADAVIGRCIRILQMQEHMSVRPLSVEVRCPGVLPA